MKKLLYCAAALATVFFAASCQQENLEPVAGGNTVTYTVQLPDAIGTKAIGEDISAVDQLIYEVYRIDENGTESRLYQMEETFDQTGTATVELELVNNQDFRVLFWAQVPETGIYNTDNLKAVELSTTLNANAENYAAFANQDVITYGENLVGRTIQLVRPVAQLNIATSAESLKLGEDVNGEHAQTTVSFGTTGVVVEGLSTVYNVAEGAGVAANDGATFTYEAKPVALSENTIKVNNVDYTYVSMNYVGFASKTGDNVKVSYTINTTNVGTITNTVNNVPVKANYRTNIIGNLITSMSDYTVTLDNDWVTEGNSDEYNVKVVSVENAAELQDAIENALTDGTETNIKLEGDINLSDLFPGLTRSATEESKKIDIPAGMEFTLDLNGYSLTGVDEETASFGLINNRGNLTITNSSSNQSRIALYSVNDRDWNAYSSVISNNPGGNLLVKGNVLIEHIGGTDMAYGIDNLTNGKGTSAIVTVDGATVKSTYRAIRQFLNGTEANNSLTVKSGSVIESTNGNKSIWMQDPSANANTGSLVVEEGAELYGNVYISATAGSTEWPVSASVAASALKDGSEVEISPKELVGYNVVLNDGVWVFEQSWSVNDDESEYTIYTAAGLKWVAEKVNEVGAQAPNIFDNATVKLANDIDLDNVEWTPMGDYGFNRTVFRGTFDGQGYTISNFKITQQASRPDKVAESSYGLFGNLSGTVKNLKIDNAKVIPGQGRFAGALVGRLKEGALVDNCHITNSAVTIEHWQVGGIAGQVNDADIKNSSISKSTITGYAGVGAIAGFLMVAGDYLVENCEVRECLIVQNGSFGGDYDAMFGLVAGNLNNSSVVLTINNVTVENNIIKDNSSNVLVGHKVEGATVYVDGSEILTPGLSYNTTSKTYAVSSAEGLVAMSNIAIKGGESVVLTADIDLAGVEFNGLNAFNSENNNTFDGKGHTVSNWTYIGKADDMGFIKNWVGTIKNLTIKNAVLRTGGRSAVIAAKPYGNIENCHVEDCNLQAGYWACGLITGMHNSGNMDNCTAKNSYIKSTGGTGAITGVLNETPGERKYSNCKVEGCTIYNEGDDPYAGAAIVGLINIDNTTVKFEACTLSDNTYRGTAKNDIYGYNAGDNTTVTVE